MNEGSTFNSTTIYCSDDVDPGGRVGIAGSDDSEGKEGGTRIVINDLSSLRHAASLQYSTTTEKYSADYCNMM